jgi:hypothetical protein
MLKKYVQAIIKAEEQSATYDRPSYCITMPLSLLNAPVLPERQNNTDKK